jgi:adenine-specific DNA-methyltransferase
MIDEKEIGTSSTVKFSRPYFDDLDSLELLDREDLLAMVKKMVGGGVVLSFHGKRTAQEIDRKVRPRQTRVVKTLCAGTPEEQSRNMIIEGENLQAMVTLYKFRGQVDLIVADPPYNTGQYFRYNDRWEKDPNDPELGTLVSLEDGSRHTKWMKAMMPRLNMMKAMLKPGGVIAICIDDNELFHLGMMMDEVFGEHNRLAVINWQKTSSKNDSGGVAKTTEYVLVYAKDQSLARTALVDRTTKANARFGSPDGDPRQWKQGDITAREERPKVSSYAIQSPFTGVLHYPGKRHWAREKKQMKALVEEWGVDYQEKDIGDDRAKALVIKGFSPQNAPEVNREILDAAKEVAGQRLAAGRWPRLYFGLGGTGQPMVKVYEDEVKAGAVPMTFWEEEFYLEPYELGCVSWNYTESGRSREGTEELKEVLGKEFVFETVKPLKLIKKIIHLWAPPNGLVLDPYAGSGTTGHAVLELNKEVEDSNRRFILVEQGAPDKGDKYARSLTRERLRRAITGERPGAGGELLPLAEPLGGGFEFRMLMQQIDAKVVLSMKRDELIDVVITSHWATGRRGTGLIRIDEPGYTYLVGKDDLREGYFVIWNGAESVGKLDYETYAAVVQEARRADLKPPYHVYARYEEFQSKNVDFNKIPDKILAHLGLNENSDRFHEEDEG